MVAFPEDYKLLVPRLLIETMGAISASFVTRIDTSTDEAASISRASVGGTVFFPNPLRIGHVVYLCQRRTLAS